MPETTWTPTVGDPVVTWHGYDDDVPGPEMAIERLTKTQVITSDGRRWKLDTLRPVGDHGYRTARLYRADDPRLAAAAQRREADAERSRLAHALRTSASWWDSHPTARAAQLKAAIIEIAPHLGLTVTDPATLCQYECGGDRCLLPADHVDSGRWHAGLGWTASLGTTTKED